ncbi:MAG TPA: GFA family protein [Myxococcota bacterium]
MYEGGCLCGALRFSAAVRPIDAGYCHCKLCQRSTGAPVLAWASFPVEAFAYTKGRATRYASSAWGHREFCNLCGTQICYRKTDAATTVDVNVGSMDNPAEFPPEHHLYFKDRISWFDTADDLPRNAESAPGAE